MADPAGDLPSPAKRNDGLFMIRRHVLLIGSLAFALLLGGANAVRAGGKGGGRSFSSGGSSGGRSFSSGSSSSGRSFSSGSSKPSGGGFSFGSKSSPAP